MLLKFFNTLSIKHDNSLYTWKNRHKLWTFKRALAHNGDKRETMHYNDVEDQP